MDTSDIIFNGDIYVPPSDNESDSEEGNSNFYVLQPVQPINDTDYGLYQHNIPVNVDHSIRNNQENESSSSDENSSLQNDISQVSSISTDPPEINLDEVFRANNTPIRPNSLFNVYDTDTDSEYSDSDNAEIEHNNDQVDNHNCQETCFMTNYIGDEDNAYNFADGWEWILQDIAGSSHGPFTGLPGLQVHPDGQTPLDYVKLFIPNSFIYHITQQTNLYASQRKQGKKQFLILSFLFFT